MSAPENARTSTSPLPAVRAAASDPSVPRGGSARTGAAGQVPPDTMPGRSTSDEPIGYCGHAVSWPEWWAGYRTCAQCQRHEELLREDVGTASLSLVIPVALFGSALLAISAASGQLGHLIRHLPLNVRPNGLTLLVLILCAAVYAGHRLLGTADVLPSIDPDAQVTELDGPWFGTVSVERPDVTP